MSEFLNLG